MWIGHLCVLLIVLGCVAYQYLKSTFVKAFAMLIITICASIVAFSYFEILANVFISRGDDSRFAFLIPWAQSLCFVLLFVLAFAILQTIVNQLTREPIDLGLWPERVGRVVCGIFLGLMLSGLLLTALAMTPLANNYPYQRFDWRNPNPERPNKVLLNADGFAAGWFSIISKGSLRGERSFASLHSAFLDQLFLNRHNHDVSVITSSQAIVLPKQKEMAACWLAPQNIEDSDGNQLQKSGYDLIFVRVGIKKSALSRNAALDAGTFTFSQLRLLCKQKARTEDRFAGKAKPIYPIGYRTQADQLQVTKLNEQIKIKRSDIEGSVQWLDLAFYVPDGFEPILVEFKQNSIVEVPSPVSADQAPPPVPLATQSNSEREGASRPDRQPKQTETASKRKGRLSGISKSIVGDGFDED